MGFDVDWIKEEIKNHMDAQPYKITCAVCGDELGFDADVDSDYDMDITVHQCKTCTEDAYNEGFRDAEISIDGRP